MQIFIVFLPLMPTQKWQTLIKWIAAIGIQPMRWANIGSYQYFGFPIGWCWGNVVLNKVKIIPSNIPKKHEEKDKIPTGSRQLLNKIRSRYLDLLFISISVGVLDGSLNIRTTLIFLVLFVTSLLAHFHRAFAAVFFVFRWASKIRWKNSIH